MHVLSLARRVGCCQDRTAAAIDVIANAASPARAKDGTRRPGRPLLDVGGHQVRSQPEAPLCMVARQRKPRRCVEGTPAQAARDARPAAARQVWSRQREGLRRTVRFLSWGLATSRRRNCFGYFANLTPADLLPRRSI